MQTVHFRAPTSGMTSLPAQNPRKTNLGITCSSMETQRRLTSQSDILKPMTNASLFDTPWSVNSAANIGRDVTPRHIDFNRTTVSPRGVSGHVKIRSERTYENKNCSAPQLTLWRDHRLAHYLRAWWRDRHGTSVQSNEPTTRSGLV